MPFRHIVMFRWADHVDHDHVARVSDALDAMSAAIPQLRGYVHGPDVGIAEGNFDYVVVADFDRVDDWRTYRDHPLHVLFVEELLTGHATDRAAVQHQTQGERSPQEASSASMQALLAEPVGEADDELLERARRAALAEMQALLAEPDDIT